MPPTSLNLSKYAVFLDFDGTLVDIAPTPDGINIPDQLPPILRKLLFVTSGATALVSGRTVAELQKFVDLTNLSIAGGHGTQHYCGHAKSNVNNTIQLPIEEKDLQSIFEFTNHHQLIVENKISTIAIHYRGQPELESQLDRLLTRTLSANSQVTLLRGKCVREIKPKGIDKGSAIAKFMSAPPFGGRRPIFVGDDVTDEDGFAWVNQNDGVSIKVGPGETCARFYLENPADVVAYFYSVIEEQTNYDVA